MIRRVQLNLKYANKAKIQKLEELMDESLRILNIFISHLWDAQQFKGTFTTYKPRTWLSARMVQCLGKQALETVKSQRKKKKKTKPVITRQTLNLDSRFLSLVQDINTFDIWIRFQSIGQKITLNLPSKKHNHFHKFNNKGWNLKSSGRLRKTDKGWFLDVFFEKEEPKLKVKGKTIGIDCGYKNLIATSDGKTYDAGLEKVYEKISRKKQGSKAFDKALTERDSLINQSVKQLPTRGVKTYVVEGLLNVKSGSKGKIRKEFNNKLQRWSYRKVFDKLSSVCEEKGISFLEVDPAYTSQTCSKCGHVAKSSRNGERFNCVSCGYTASADHNAAVNILNRGVYSFPAA